MKIIGHIESRKGKYWLIIESLCPFPWFRVARMARIQQYPAVLLELKKYLKQKAEDGMTCNGRP